MDFASTALYKNSVSVAKEIARMGLVVLGVTAVVVAPASIISRACNYVTNTGARQTTAYNVVSYSDGFFGHVDYTRFPDGSQDVLVIPESFRGGIDTMLYQDNDGDGTVDLIRTWAVQGLDRRRLEVIAARSIDYDSQRGKFDAADMLLQDLMRRHGAVNMNSN